LALRPLTWIELVNAFAFDASVFTLLFLGIGAVITTSVLVLLVLTLVFARRASPPKLHFLDFVPVATVPMLQGLGLAMIVLTIPVLILYIVFGRLYPFNGFIGSYTEVVSVTTQAQWKARVGRLGSATIVAGITVTMIRCGARDGLRLR
jgi:hypothetical protein